MVDPRARLGRRAAETPSLILTPFIDVLLVLLCFVLAASFTIRAAVEVQLPEAATGRLLAEDQLTVSIGRDGTLVVQGRRATVEGFPAVLAQVLAGRKDAPGSALIEGDEQIPYALLVQVMDLLRAQGVTDLSLVTQGPGAR